MCVISHSPSWWLWRCIIAHVLNNIHMHVAFVINLLPGAVIWRRITAYILGNIHTPAKCVVNLSLDWVIWRLIITYILEEVHICAMYVINLSLNIATWRSIDAYMMKYACILVMWNESFNIVVWTSLAHVSHIQVSHSDSCKAGLCAQYITLLRVINMNHSKGGRGTWWCSRLRHRATNRKVAGSIPDGVIGIFHRHPSGCTMALGLTQPVTEMSTGSISWGVKVVGP